MIPDDGETKGMMVSDSMLSLATLADSRDSALSSELQCPDCYCEDMMGGPRSAMVVKTLDESLKNDMLVHDRRLRAAFVETPTGITKIYFDSDDNGDRVLPKKVRFDSVEVREHSYILGCNPGGTSGGPPLTICWDVLSSSILPLDEYEATRGPERRSNLLLKKSKTERWNLLTKLGFGSDELRAAEAYTDEIRNSRKESARERSDLQALLNESKRRIQEAKKTKVRRGSLLRFFRKPPSTAAGRTIYAES
jgi:hypothetical protein